VIGGLARLAVAAGGSAPALRRGGELGWVFVGQTAIVYGLVNATAIAGGAWFGPVRWPGLARRAV
jgi:hypothetical protein